MSPTIFRYGEYRFFFFSREETRKHVHIISSSGEAKFWMVPEIKLAKSIGFNNKQINNIEKIIKENKDEIIKKWNEHFG